MKVVGVTGSVGKSTTKEMIAGVLSGTFKVGKSPVNHNNDIGLPMSILALPEDTEVAVLEMGMDSRGEIDVLADMVRPDIAVITNNGIYHAADFYQGGTGYYANGSKIIPITWTCDGEKEPFRYYTMDGQPLSIGQGNTYIGIIPTGSAVSYS